MKLRLTLYTIMLCCVQAIAQSVQSYRLETGTAPYIPLNNATVVPLNLSGLSFNSRILGPDGQQYGGSIEDVDGFPIGFSFQLGDRLFDRFLIGTHGFLLLGSDKLSFAPLQANSAFMQAYNVVGFMAPKSVFATDKTAIAYRLEGEVGNRILTVQYDNVVVTETWDETPLCTLNFQVKLRESDDNIMVQFGKCTIDNPDLLPQKFPCIIGVKGNTDEDFIVKTQSFTSTDVGYNVDEYVNWSNQQYPEEGRYYLWKTADVCSTPQNPAINFTDGYVATDKMNRSFTATVPADKYLALLVKDKQLTTTPLDKTVYKVGDIIGNAEVIAFSSEKSCSKEGLEGNSNYQLYVFAANTKCLDGPKYNIEHPGIWSFHTKAIAPEYIQTVETDSTAVVLKSKGNADNNDILIAMSTEYGKDEFGSVAATGKFGSPTADLNVGDVIEGGGIVVYKGKATDFIELDKLQPATVYHFRAWSIGTDNECSTTFSEVGLYTPKQVPWVAPMNDYPLYYLPWGWTGDQWECYGSRNSSLRYISARLRGNATTGTDFTLETPYIYLSEGENRIKFNLLLTRFLGRQNKPYTFVNDWMKVEVSEDGVNYLPIATYKADNMPVSVDDKTPVGFQIPFTQLSGKKVRVRVVLHLYNEVTASFYTFEVDKKPDCSYPKDVMLTPHQDFESGVRIQWTPQGEEDAWEIRYKKSVEETWLQPIVVREPAVVLTDLYGLTNYDVQVRARCAADKVSDWTETYTFRSGFMVPFTQEYKTEKPETVGWIAMTGQLASPSVLTEGGAWKFMASYRGAYLSYNSIQTEANDWYVSPVINLGDGTAHYEATVSYMVATESKATQLKVSLAVAKDGEHFYPEDVYPLFDATTVPTLFEPNSKTVSLKKYQGKIRLAYLVEAAGGTPPLMRIEGITLNYTCPMTVENLRVQDVTPTAATVKWTGSSESYLVFVRPKGDTQRHFSLVEGTEWHANNLLPETSYEVGVTHSCEPGDTAKVVMTSFTTLPLPECVAPTYLTVDEVGADTAKLSWKGPESVPAYNLRYRESTMDQWTEISGIDTTSYTLTGLKPQTTYIWRVQSQCEGNQSAWSTQQKFSTKEVEIPTFIGNTDVKDVQVYVRGSVVNIVNDAHSLVQRIDVLTLSGSQIISKQVHTTDHIFFTLNQPGTYLVRIWGKHTSKAVKIYVE